MSDATISSALRLLWYCTIGAHAVLALRLFWIGLHQRYRWFAGFLVFGVVRSCTLAAFPFQTSQAYADVYTFSQPLLWLLQILVVLELFSLVFQHYRGLASAGRWVMSAGLAFALVISSLTLGPDLATKTQYPILKYYGAIDRGIQTSLVLFLLCVTAFLAWYPVPLSRNVLVHSLVYAAYFFAGAVIVFAANLTSSTGGKSVAYLIHQFVDLACVGIWLLLLTRHGEEVTVSKRPQWQADDEAHLLGQLAAINNSLLRTARK